MSYSTRKIKRDADKVPAPQYFNVDTDDFEVQQGSNGASFVQLIGSNVAEQKTQANAVSGSVAFSKPIQHLEIYNVDSTNAGVFTVNGINITVPAGKSFKASYAGTHSATVSITGSTSYILTRYE